MLVEEIMSAPVVTAAPSETVAAAAERMRDLKEKAMGDLDAMQFNHARLFPGPDGFAKEAKAKVGIDLKIKSTPKA